jgi:hypothetical protein
MIDLPCAFIGSDAKIKQASLQKSFIENEANEKSLMQIVQSKASNTDQKNLALFKTLQKSRHRFNALTYSV